MKKLLGIVAVTVAILSGGFTSAAQAQSEEKTIFCDETRAEPMTVARISGDDHALIVWRSQYWSNKALSPLERCRIVSARLHNLRTENYKVGLSTLNRVPVLCKVGSNSECLALILTMEPGEQALRVYQEFVSVTSHGRGQPMVRGVDDVVDFSTMLQYSLSPTGVESRMLP